MQVSIIRHTEEVLKCQVLNLTHSWFRKICVKTQQLKIKDTEVILGHHSLMFKPNREKEFFHHEDNALKPSLKDLSLRKR